MLLTATVPGAPADTDAEACVIREFPGMGPACELESGLFEVFDENGVSLGTTHGPDYGVDDGNEILPAYSKAPACVQDEEQAHYARVFYAWASDRGPSKSDDQIRALLDAANGILFLEAYNQGGFRDIRVDCELHVGVGLKTVVNRVQLDTPLGQTTFSSVVSDLKSTPGLRDMDDPRIHYWVYFEDRLPGQTNLLGQGHVLADETQGVENENNGGGYAKYALTYGHYDPTTMLHELTHNMGGVQYNSPNSSGSGWHCNDGHDIMCYSDGGDKSNYRTTACSSEKYDCGRDDYFNLDPEYGSYLYRNWNLADVEHRFLRGCGEAQGTLALGAGPVELSSPRTYQSHQFGRTCSDRPFYLEGYGQDLYVRPLDDAGFDYQNQADMDVCFYDGSVLLECEDRLSKVESGRTPFGTDRVRIYAKGHNAVDYFLRIG